MGGSSDDWPPLSRHPAERNFAAVINSAMTDYLLANGKNRLRLPRPANTTDPSLEWNP
jgi:hypothetical protein